MTWGRALMLSLSWAFALRAITDAAAGRDPNETERDHRRWLTVCVCSSAGLMGGALVGLGL